MESRVVDNKKAIEEKKSLLTYSNWRLLPDAGKILYSLLVGLSVATTFVLSAVLHPLVLTLFAGFAGAFILQSAYETKKKINREKEAIESLVDEINQTLKSLSNINDKLNLIANDELIPLIKKKKKYLDNQLEGISSVTNLEDNDKVTIQEALLNQYYDDVEKIYVALLNFKNLLEKFIPFIKANEALNSKAGTTQFSSKDLEALREQVVARINDLKMYREHPGGEVSLDDSQNKKIKKGNKVFNKGGKILSAGLAFAAGAAGGFGIATTAIAIGFGFAAVGAMLSNPIGWAFLATIGVSLLMGVTALGIEYLYDRWQDKKIKKLEKQKNDILFIKNDLLAVTNVLQQSQNHLHSFVQSNKLVQTIHADKMDKQQILQEQLLEEKQRDNARLRRVNEELTTQLDVSRKETSGLAEQGIFHHERGSHDSDETDDQQLQPTGSKPQNNE